MIVMIAIACGTLAAIAFPVSVANVGKEFLAEVEVNEMALEKPSYRDNLERIKEVYPNKEMLNVKNVATFCGLNRKTVLELFGFNKGYISVAKLAREMS